MASVMLRSTYLWTFTSVDLDHGLSNETAHVEEVKSVQRLTRQAMDEFTNVFGSYDYQLIDSLMLTCPEIVSGCELSGIQFSGETCCQPPLVSTKPL